MDAPRIVTERAHELATGLARGEERDKATLSSGGATDIQADVVLAGETAFTREDPAPRVDLCDQPYLSAAGVNLPVRSAGANAARWASYDGTGIQFIQIENGWNVMHKAFDYRVRQESPGSDFGLGQLMHGNAGLGIVLANGEESEIRGVAPGCTLRGLYAINQMPGPPAERLERAIQLAAANLQPGDVILLSLQVNDTRLPVEVDPGVFGAIRAATSRGIIVVEAAGNSGGSLEDALQYPEHATAWAVQDEDIPRFNGLPDSGAIIVSGCTVAVWGPRFYPPVQDEYTRRGPRVDCCAWSRYVWTSYGEPSEYHFFKGTSASAPVIAGLALIIQHRAKECLGRPLTPVEMRALLRDPTCGTEVRPIDKSCPISMPDAVKLFERLDELPN